MLDPKLLEPQKIRPRKVSVFAHRAYKHINSFIRVNIHFRDGSEFPLTLDINNTLEYVARQIEAEATIRRLDFTESGDIRRDDLSKAIDVYQLYDAANLAIPFSATVKDTLVFGDDIFPITSEDDSNSKGAEAKESTPFIKLKGPSFLISTKGLEKSDDNNPLSPISAATHTELSHISTIEDRLDSVLHNISALQFFNEFCLQEYTIENVLFWIEAEVFRSITNDSTRKAFAKHLVETYVKLDAPLSLNVDGEVRQAVLSKYQDPETDMFEELQSFIYILIKQAAYIRFESSAIFQNFLKFKKEDRYAYVQGKTDWSFVLLNKNHVLEGPVGENSGSEGTGKDNLSSLFFRQKVLLDVLGRYFPFSSKVTQKYFDMGERKELGARYRNVHKQRKLAKFFGGQPGEEYMKYQVDDPKGADAYSISSEPENSGRGSERSDVGGQDADQKRKKAEKLSGFFGNHLPGRQMKIQGLQDESGQGTGSHTDDLEEEEEEKFIGTVNLLTPEEKIALQKRAKKLLGILGTGVDGKPLTPSQIVSLKSNHARQEEDSGIDELSTEQSTDDSSMSSLHLLTPNIKLLQKSRLDKLSHVMGERISEDHLKDYIDDPNLPRPLTPNEKKILLKKNSKLERMFGNTVPAEEVINYESLSQSNLLHFDRESTESIPFVSPPSQLGPSRLSVSTIPEAVKTEEERKNRLLRLRKLRKMLGLNDGSVPLTEEALNQIQEAINNIVDDESDKKSLFDELKQEFKRQSMDPAPLSVTTETEGVGKGNNSQGQSPSTPKDIKAGFQDTSSTPKASSPRLEKRPSRVSRTGEPPKPAENRASKTGQQ